MTSSAPEPPPRPLRQALRQASRQLRRQARHALHTLREDLFRVPVRTMPPMNRPRFLRRLPHTFFVLLALVLMLAGTQLESEYGLDADFATTLAVAGSVTVVLALYRPMLAWWASVAVFVVTAEAIFPPPDTGSPWPWAVAGLFGHAAVQLLLSLRVPMRVSAETLALILVLTGLLDTLGTDARYSHSFGFAVVLFSVAALVGTALRGRREARRALQRQETRTAEERARRTLLEERSRIARELHDVVAHHMSVISIQAEAAPYRVAEPPEELTRSFAVIRENAVEALAELRRVLGVLRSEDELPDADAGASAGADIGTGAPAPAPAPADKAPQPTLERLDDLVANVRTAGLDVRTTVTGRPRPLPQGVELSVYRIVQEALSNALRHAPGSHVHVELVHEEGAIRVRITNTAPGRRPDASPGAGHGLLGMRERATMLGGEFAAGPTPDGGYEVVAELPRTPEGDPG